MDNEDQYEQLVPIPYKKYEQLTRRIFPNVNSNDDRQYVVYWISDNTCKTPLTDGYIGVALKSRFHARWLEHLRSDRFKNRKNEVKIEIILEDYAEMCYMREFIYRPCSNTGWNIAPGGARGFKLGVAKSDATKKKISDAHLGIKRPDLALYNKTKILPIVTCTQCGVTGKGNDKFYNQHFDNCGKNILTCPFCGSKGTERRMMRWHFGNCKKKSKIECEVKPRRKKEKTKVTCPHCGTTGGGGNMTRYHFDNCGKHLEKGRKNKNKSVIHTCPHCGVSGRGGAMIQHHFDNCGNTQRIHAHIVVKSEPAL